MSTPYLASIAIYPIKALDAVHVSEVQISPGGALAGDREFALVDKNDRIINGKRSAKVHQIRAEYNWPARRVTLGVQDERAFESFHLDQDQPKLTQWFSSYFEQPVRLERNTDHGFPDDEDATGPTVCSTGTFKEIAEWYPGLTPEDVWRRFRVNLVIGGTEAFWEDRLCTREGQTVKFRIGDVGFEGTGPCQRCIVPMRDPHTGEPWPDFQKIFMDQRKATLPKWACVERFDHFYRLTINTRIPASPGKELMIGRPIEVVK